MLLRLRRPATEYVPPRKPSAQQQAFIESDAFEAAYGGGQNSGKSDSLLRAALRDVDKPGYRALILRRTFRDLVMPGAIFDRAKEWLAHTDAKLDRELYTFTFPSGARLVFGHMQLEADKKNYDGSEFHFLGIDEAQHFTWGMVSHVIGRVRRVEGDDIPLRVRLSCMPGGIGHDWIEQRYVSDGTRDSDVEFYHATIRDNPVANVAEYQRALARMSETERMQKGEGRWVRANGGIFKREWFRYCDAREVPSSLRLVRFWDLASSEPREGAMDPDYTAGALVGVMNGRIWIIDMERGQKSPDARDKMIRATGLRDGPRVPVWVAQHRNQGETVTSAIARYVLPGYAVRGLYEQGDKSMRADPVAAAAERGDVTIVRGPWNAALVDELVALGNGAAHDDQVDAVSGAVHVLEHEMMSAPSDVTLAGRPRTTAGLANKAF